MSRILPVNLDALLHCRGVESERVEFKASWDPATTGVQVLRTICAFANDYHNLNGGYIVIGVGERDGRAALPPVGLSAEAVEAAQKWIRGNCNRLDPPYPPILSPETVDGRLLLVVWAPASEMRPHRAPAEGGGRVRYWVRVGAETVDAEQRGDMLRRLIQQTARVPWDDRRASDARVEDIREAKVREYLRDVNSGLLDEPEARDVYRRMRVEVTSYPGPVPGIEHRHLVANAEVRAAPARNRRIGEFLKELGLAEGRLSGLPKVFRAMEENGSPAPSFDFDEQRTFFQATLPAHPEFGALSALRDVAHLSALGQQEEAVRRIESAWASNPASAILAREMIRSFGQRGEIGRAEEVLKTFEAQGPAGAVSHVANTLVDVLLEAGDERKAQELLRRNRPMMFGQDAIDAAILARRLRDSRAAHRYFERAGDALNADPRALHEFAQTKIWLATEAHHRRQRDSNRRLLNEARTLLERVIQLDASPTRHAWAWRELARTLNWLRAPFREVEDAYRKAIEHLPAEARFVRELETIRAVRG